MPVMRATAMPTPATVTRARPVLAWRVLATPLGLYFLALLVRVAAIAAVPFSFNEGSAYYVTVAGNIASGRGPVIDAVWSYATPPLTLPRPAFELWQPLASFVAALPMQVLGPALASAQLGFAVLGAVLAPLTWLVARDAAARLDIRDGRAKWVAIGAGLFVAVGGPFVLSAAVPDSTLPFTVFAVAACVAMPGAARGERAPIVALGVLLGLAYLTRMEAVYLGLVFVGVAWAAGARRISLVRRVGTVALVGALVALPWWLRNLAVFGTPLPGQLADNAFLTANEQIFNYISRPSFDTFLAQGPAVIAANIGAGLWHNLVDVLLFPGNVITVVALITIVVGWRHRASLRSSPLTALVAYGVVCFAVTSVLFPVATLWGTFEHASGPLLVSFAVLAALGGDAFVVRVRAWRRWPRPNAGMAPAGLAAVVLAMTVLQLTLVSVQSRTRQSQIDGVASAALAAGLVEDSAPLISDHPIWLSEATGAPALALPQEGADAVTKLAHAFGAHFIVLFEPPSEATFDESSGASQCVTQRAVPVPGGVEYLGLYEISEGCA
jgi:hypothetical protein